MTHRMMGGCLGAAWDGPQRAAYASPAVGGPSHVQAFAWGRCQTIRSQLLRIVDS